MNEQEILEVQIGIDDIPETICKFNHKGMGSECSEFTYWLLADCQRMHTVCDEAAENVSMLTDNEIICPNCKKLLDDCIKLVRI